MSANKRTGDQALPPLMTNEGIQEHKTQIMSQQQAPTLQQISPTPHVQGVYPLQVHMPPQQHQQYPAPCSYAPQNQELAQMQEWDNTSRVMQANYTNAVKLVTVDEWGNQYGIWNYCGVQAQQQRQESRAAHQRQQKLGMPKYVQMHDVMKRKAQSEYDGQSVKQTRIRVHQHSQIQGGMYGSQRGQVYTQHVMGCGQHGLTGQQVPMVQLSQLGQQYQPGQQGQFSHQRQFGQHNQLGQQAQFGPQIGVGYHHPLGPKTYSQQMQTLERVFKPSPSSPTNTSRRTVTLKVGMACPMEFTLPAKSLGALIASHNATHGASSESTASATIHLPCADPTEVLAFIHWTRSGSILIATSREASALISIFGCSLDLMCPQYGIAAVLPFFMLGKTLEYPEDFIVEVFSRTDREDINGGVVPHIARRILVAMIAARTAGPGKRGLVIRVPVDERWGIECMMMLNTYMKNRGPVCDYPRSLMDMYGVAGRGDPFVEGGV
ncbi:hypothetical protein K470DRAFT_291198 [Piedraia hortae CBS 480.64]|uniref:Uncharacterized protein n=1 Tax=Piedraia hortae CBS 480.64 TaxID=1314780 RepID=A0A6A7BS35_9PEZI|nr:hypothetical protein K470DRAFT_291198 [Piedraia hortae CBS 480.64]